MYTGTVWGITLIIVGFILSLGALQLVSTATAPGLVGQASRNLERSSGFRQVGYFAVGAFLVALWIIAIGGFGNGSEAAKILTFPFVALGALAIAPAFAASSLYIGGRLPDPSDVASPWRRLVRGATALGLSWAVPFVGQVLILPLTLGVGLGAVTHAVFQRAGRKEAGQAFLLRTPTATETVV